MPISKIYYFMDPMCGWCYGFSNQVQKMRQTFPEIPIELVCGGMVPPKSEGPLGDRGKYILRAIPRVEKQTGIEFGEAYKKGLETGKIWNGSLKPSVAINIMKSHSLDLAFQLFQMLQKAYFFMGKNLNENSTYEEILSELQVNVSEFLYLMGETNWTKQALDEFAFTGQVGITGFPTLVGEVEEKLVLITNGYIHADKLESFLINLKSNHIS